MKTKLLIYFLFLLIVFKTDYSFSQQQLIPEIELTSLDGRHMNSIDIFTENEAYVLVFWESYKYSDIEKINNIIEERDNNPGSIHTKIIAICIDELGITGHIAPVVHANGWDVEVYIDTNGDFKRAMSVNSTDNIYLIDSAQQSFSLIGRRDILALELFFLNNSQITFQSND